MDTATGPAPPARTPAFVLLAVLLACAAWWGGLSPALQPPAVVPATAPATAFSAERAREHLRAITRQPRPLGSEGHAAARAYLLDTLRGLGLEPQVQETTALRPRPDVIHSRVRNIVARMPGTGQGPAVVLTAHYDSVAHSPGANDAGNGVAAILETVRALRAGPPLRNDVIVLITDAEEIGLMGAIGYVADHPWAADTGVVLSAEGRGRGGPVYMFRTAGENGGIIRALARSAPWALADSVSDELFKHMPNNTDLSVFREAGHLGLDFANARGFNHYHTVLDSFELADPRTLQHHGEYLVAMVRAFGDMDLSTLAAPRRIYFAVPLAGLAHYPAAWALPLALLAAALSGWLAVAMLRAREWRLRGIAIASLHFAAALVALPLLAWLGWSLAGRWIPELAWFDHGSPYGGHRYLLAFALAASAAYVASLPWLRRRARASELLAAPLLAFVLLSLATALWAPGASYVFLWPLLAAMAGMAVARRLAPERAGARAVILALAALPVLFFMVPMILGIEESMTMDGLAGAIAMLVLMLGLLAPQLDFATRPNGAVLPAVLAVAGIGLLAAALLDTGFSEQRRKPNTLEYIADADRGEAFWVSVDPEPDEWTRLYLGDDPARGPLPDWAPWQSRHAGDPWFRPAAPLRDDAPDVRVLDEAQADGLRHLRLQVLSPPDAYVTLVEFPADLAVTGLRVDGREPPEGHHSGRLQVLSYAPGPEPVELAFTIPDGAPLRLLLRTNIIGLPPLPGGEVPARPPHTMPLAPWTERTRLQRTVEL